MCTTSSPYVAHRNLDFFSVGLCMSRYDLHFLTVGLFLFLIHGSFFFWEFFVVPLQYLIIKGSRLKLDHSLVAEKVYRSCLPFIFNGYLCDLGTKCRDMSALCNVSFFILTYGMYLCLKLPKSPLSIHQPICPFCNIKTHCVIQSNTLILR